jgi:hypothetical protein
LENGASGEDEYKTDLSFEKRTLDVTQSRTTQKRQDRLVDPDVNGNKNPVWKGYGTP